MHFGCNFYCLWRCIFTCISYHWQWKYAFCLQVNCVLMWFCYLCRVPGAIWQHGSRSTLVQVMACCLTTPSHYQNQCWLSITKVQWCSSEGKFAWYITKICLKIIFLRFYWNLRGANELIPCLLMCSLFSSPDHPLGRIMTTCGISVLRYVRKSKCIFLLNTQIMMTSSNGNIFHVTGHLCGEFTGHRWIPRTKASDAELWCFLWSASE